MNFDECLNFEETQSSNQMLTRSQHSEGIFWLWTIMSGSHVKDSLKRNGTFSVLGLF